MKLLVGAVFTAYLALLLTIPHVQGVHGLHVEWMTPAATSGDEPHYLLVVNTILHSHTFELQDAYYRATHPASWPYGGWDACGINLGGRYRER